MSAPTHVYAPPPGWEAISDKEVQGEQNVVPRRADEIRAADADLRERNLSGGPLGLPVWPPLALSQLELDAWREPCPSYVDGYLVGVAPPEGDGSVGRTSLADMVEAPDFPLQAWPRFAALLASPSDEAGAVHA
ncbi:hypothetical protein Q5752_006015 [Cryptotrichosporon argae]